MSKHKDRSYWKMTPEQLESWLRLRSNKVPNKKRQYKRSDKSWRRDNE